MTRKECAIVKNSGEGMYFLHPDHLGSISMITDGYKKPITEQSINYKPYGEIDYKDSDGVNLSKYKYTGQEEDKESGLLYYKSRYYDPMLARFLQADSEVDIDEVSGMNRYMYVVGSPVNFKDDSGKWCTIGIIKSIAGALLGGIIGAAGGVIYNYTGGGGNCSKNKPDEKISVFLYITDLKKSNNEKIFDFMIAHEYYEFQKKRGESTFLNTQTTANSHATLKLLLLANPNLSDIQKSFIYHFMTTDVTKPQKGVDQASYQHDLYSGDMQDPRNRRGTNLWVKNAWKRAYGPDQILVAAVGTVLFKSINLIHDVTHIKYSQYKPSFFTYKPKGIFKNLNNPKKWTGVNVKL